MGWGFRGVLGLVAACALASSTIGLVGPSGIAAAQMGHELRSHSTVKIVFLGDSTAETLAWSLGIARLDQKYHDSVEDLGNIGCGLVTGPEERFMGVPYYPKSDCNGSPATPGEPPSAQPLR